MGCGSYVEVGGVECVVFDEGAPRGDVFAHEHREGAVGDGSIGDFDLEEAAFLGVHGGFVELLGVHFAESFVALDIEAAAPYAADGFNNFNGAMDWGGGW